MRKTVIIAAAAALGATVLSVSLPGTAAALGGETLGCRVTPARAGTPVSPGNCGNTANANSSGYDVGFQVLNESGTYSFSWQVPAQYTSKIQSGCTSGTDYCSFLVGRSAGDVTVSVSVAQNGATETLSATADIEPYCGNAVC